MVNYARAAGVASSRGTSGESGSRKASRKSALPSILALIARTSAASASRTAKASSEGDMRRNGIFSGDHFDPIKSWRGFGIGATSAWDRRTPF